jgi:hypothetical protein
MQMPTEEQLAYPPSRCKDNKHQEELIQFNNYSTMFSSH